MAGDPQNPDIISKDEFQNAIGNPIFVQISDGNEIIEVNVDGSINIGSIIPGVGATDLGKAEDAVHSSGDVGVEMLAVRNDTLASLVDLDGDYAPLQVDANGALYITGDITVDNTFDYAEDSQHLSGDFGAFVLSVRADILGGQSTTDGDYQALVTDALGALYVNVNSITANYEYDEDTQHFSGDEGVFVLSVRADILGGTINNRRGLSGASDRFSRRSVCQCQ